MAERVWYHALSLHVLTKTKLRASSSSPRLPLCPISFLFAYSITHSPSLFDAPGTKAPAFHNSVCSCYAAFSINYHNYVHTAITCFLATPGRNPILSVGDVMIM